MLENKTLLFIDMCTVLFIHHFTEAAVQNLPNTHI